MDMVVAIAGTVVAILGLYEQSRTANAPYRLTALGRVILVFILVSGLATLATLANRRNEVAQERKRAEELQAKVESARETLARTGERLQTALQENSRLAASIDVMKQELTAIRTSAHEGGLVLQPVNAKITDERWHDNQIVLRLRLGYIKGQRYFKPSQRTVFFSAEQFRTASRIATVELVNVRHSDLADPLLQIIGERDTFMFRRTEVYCPAFGHGDVVTIRQVPDSEINFNVELVPNESFDFAQFLVRNPDAALRITLK